jgi:oligoribonuclease
MDCQSANGLLLHIQALKCNDDELNISEIFIVADVKKNDVPKNLVWMDLEMTGLDSDSDVIIEMATLITDLELNVLEVGPEIVILRPAALFDKMDLWNRTQHTKSGLWDKVVTSTTSQEQAELITLDFIKKHSGPRESPLCGNSIWQDRRFIAKHMKLLDNYLHYRLIDVSSIKILGKMWYPAAAEKGKPKKNSHRALDDILESIEELRYYRKILFK